MAKVSLLKHIAKSNVGFAFDIANSFAEAKQLIADNGGDTRDSV